MKKEKDEKKEEEKIEKDAMKLDKKFKSLKNIFAFIKGVVLIPAVLVVLLLITTIGQYALLKKTPILNIVVRDIIYDGENDSDAELTRDDVIRFSGKVTKTDIEKEYKDFKTQDAKMFIAIQLIIKMVVDYILCVWILNCVIKLFDNISKAKTPFTQDNIKLIKKIDILACFAYIFGNEVFSIGLVFLLVLTAISYVFKYGYTLQKEVDETV